MIKSLTLANLNFMEALLQEENSDVTHWFTKGWQKHVNMLRL
jgi:hypothetical protein